MGSAKQISGSDEQGRTNQFIHLSSEIASFAKSEDLSITPFDDAALPHFSQMTEGDREHVLWQLETLRSVLDSVQAERDRLRSARSLTWGFLKHMKYTVPTELFHWLDDSDHVDAYSADHKMLFASLEVFRFLSYSLEDFYCRPWTKLFKRDRQGVHEALFSLSNNVLKGLHPGIVSTDYVPTHVTIETESKHAKRIIQRPRFFSPLYENGRIVGYLCVNQLQPLAHRELAPSWSESL